MMNYKNRPSYLCLDCGWVGTWRECRNEHDFGYDQSCCPNCGDVMFDNLRGIDYCEKVETDEN